MNVLKNGGTKKMKLKKKNSVKKLIAKKETVNSKSSYNDIEELYDTFFVIKGQFSSQKYSPKNVTSDTSEICIDGFNPSDPNCSNWFQIRDRNSFFCIYCGSDLKRGLEVLENNVRRLKTKHNYYKMVAKLTNDDYYRINYLGLKPFSEDQLLKNVIGKCPRTSPSMSKLFAQIYFSFSTHFYDDVEFAVRKGYEKKKLIRKK